MFKTLLGGAGIALVPLLASCGAAPAQSQQNSRAGCAVQEADVARFKQWVSTSNAQTLPFNQSKLASANVALKQCQEAKVYADRGFSLMDANDFAGAITQFRQASQKYPGDSRIALALGTCLMQHHDVQEAIAVFRNSLQYNPNDWMLHLDLGIALTTAGNAAEAVTEFKKSSALNPSGYEPHFNLAYLLQHNGDVPGSISEYRTAIQLNPDHQASYDNLMQALIATGDRAGTDELMNGSHQHLTRGNELFQAGDNEGAIKEYRRAIAMFSPISTPHYNLGIALVQQGNRDEAIAEFRNAIERYNASGESGHEIVEYHVALGSALYHKGDRAGAISEYKKALEVDPHDANALSNLQIVSQE